MTRAAQQAQWLNPLRRERFCVPLDRDPHSEAPFFCSLGTLWCTEAHGDYEIAWALERPVGKFSA